MHIADILNRDSTTISFEFFPPKSETGWDALFQRISDFEALQPSFVSVTYGAGGSTRQRTHDVVVRLHQETTLDPIPHFTCVGHTNHEVEETLNRYAREGVSNILAIRGDPPQDSPGFNFDSGDFKFAADLVAFIHAFNNAGKHPNGRGFGIGIAGFPEGHPDAANRLVEMEHLKAKVEAGADYVCTQLFFDNRAFYDWRDRCQLLGIDLPLIAGIMPIVSIKGMKRMADLSPGTNFPAGLQRSIYRAQDDPEAVERVGIHWATEQCRDLLENDVRGIHFYTLNKSTATKRIHETLGAATSRALME